MASRTHDPGGRTLAQWYCLLGGAALLLAGIAGFIAEASFGTGDSLEGANLIVFEVNGWHNLVHIGSGLVLLAAANTAPTARLTAIAFGLVYGLVTLIGLADGSDVFGLIPVNAADNILHLLLALLGIVAGFMSPMRRAHAGRGGSRRDRGAGGDRFDRTADGAGTGYAHEGQRGIGSVAGGERRH